MKKEITILTSWKWDVYEIEWSVEDYMKMQMEAKAKWEDWFWSNKYRCKIKFSALEKESWKTHYLSIEAPKYEPTQEQKASLIIKELAKKAEINKEERFIKKRSDILENLRLEEKRLWLMPTVEKIECYNKYKLTK